MKTFFLCALVSLGTIICVNAQQKTYTPNARQAVQKSRMQQPQYMKVTADQDKAKQRKDQVAAATPQTVNYQIERPLAIDAPKRRSKKRTSNFAKLAGNLKK